MPRAPWPQPGPVARPIPLVLCLASQFPLSSCGAIVAVAGGTRGPQPVFRGVDGPVPGRSGSGYPARAIRSSAAASSAASAATSVGRSACGQGGELRRGADAGEHQDGARAHGDGRRDVRDQAVADHHGLGHGPAHRPRRDLQEKRTGLADRDRFHAAGGRDGRNHGPGPGHRGPGPSDRSGRGWWPRSARRPGRRRPRPRVGHS